MYPVFGIRGASWFLGMSEWSFAVLLFLGFWHKRLGVLGALGSCAAFLGTATIIPFMPDGWAPSAGGVSAPAGHEPLFIQDGVLFSGVGYLLEQGAAPGAPSAPPRGLVLGGGGPGGARRIRR